MIDNFSGDYRFLSNFWVEADGGSVESKFQAAKTLDLDEYVRILAMEPGAAKRAGRAVTLREDWESVKDDVMFDLVWNKFASDEELAQKLLDTGDEELLEGNTWHDMYWGIDIVTRRGQNKLGEILMSVRDTLKQLESEGWDDDGF